MRVYTETKTKGGSREESSAAANHPHDTRATDGPAAHQRPGPARTPLALVALMGLAALMALGAAACVPGINGSGNVKTESRAVSGFSSVRLNGVGRLSITQTGTESLKITTDDNILPLIVSTVSNGTLTIGIKPGNAIGQVTQLDYALTVKTLQGIEVSGAATVTATSITTDALNVSLSGAGDAAVSGQAQSLSVAISGAGSYDGRQFATHSATVTISGAGSASVAASDTLDATISGAGGVTYYGNPHITQHISGAGSIKQG